MRALIVTTSEMSELFQVGKDTIAEWVKAGMPKVAHGKFDFCPAFEWWKENINTDEKEEATVDARERYWNAKAEEAEIKVGQAKGNLIPKGEVHQEWACRAAELKTGLRAWASWLAPALEGKDLVELRVILRDAADEILATYCRNGRFSPDSGGGPDAKKKRGSKK